MKKKRSRLLALCLALVMLLELVPFLSMGVLAADGQIPEEGLILYSSFDEGTAADLSGLGHDGTLAGKPTFPPGKLGRAIRFGEASQGSYVNYGRGMSEALGAGDFTVGFWVRLEGAASDGCAILSNRGSGRGFSLESFSTAYDKDLRARFSTAGIREMRDFPASDGEWQHLTLTAERNGQVRLYRNGSFWGSLRITMDQDGALDGGLPLVLGADGALEHLISGCSVDELRIYNRVLSGQEIRALTAMPEGSMPEPLVYCSFDDGTAQDLSGFGNHGQMIGEIPTVNGISGAALHFDNTGATGSGSVTAAQCVDFGRELSRQLATSDFTISLWLEFENFGSDNSTVISNKDYSSGSNLGYALGSYNYPQAHDLRSNFCAVSGYRLESKNIPGNHPGWHHVVIVADRDGEMQCYLDNQLNASISIASQAGKSLDAGYPWVLGADGTKHYAVGGCTMDELRIYNCTLTAREVSGLYEQGGCTRDLEKLLDRVNQVKESAAFHPEDLDAMRRMLEGYRDAVSEASAQEGMALVKEAGEKLEKMLDGRRPLASFHIISDVHIDGSAEREALYTGALEDMKTIWPETNIAFVIPGDFTCYSAESEYKTFYEYTKAHNPCTPENTLILLGNHDVRGTYNYWERDPNKVPANWPGIRELYKKYNAPYMPQSAQETLYHSKVLGGYTFIMLNTEVGIKDAMFMSDAQLAFIEQEMKKSYEEDPTRPVFLVSHQPLNNTHWMGNVLDGFDGLANGTGPYGSPQSYSTGKDLALKEVMKKYPVGVFISGHVHNMFGVIEAQTREYGTVLDIPSLVDPCVGVFGLGGGNHDKGTGFEAMIYEDQIVFRARDFSHSEWMPQFDEVVDARMPGTYQEALRKQKAGNSTPALDEAIRTAHDLMDRKYDQQALTWDYTAPPEEPLFHDEGKAELRLAHEALKKALGELPPDTAYTEVPARESTCTEDGNILYWEGTDGNAYVEKNGAMEQISREETVLKATGHRWGEPQFTFSQDGKSAEAVFTCQNDPAHKVTQKAEVTAQIAQEATCTEKGVTAYTARAELEGKTYTAREERTDIPLGPHSLEHAKEVPARVGQEGTKEHWVCTVCGRSFLDARGSREASPEELVLPALELPFEDVPENSWFYPYVAGVYELELMKGKSDTLFAPEAKLTRGELAQILYNMEGRPQVTEKSPFPDVQPGHWFHDAVVWASAEGYVMGYSSGKFGPTDRLTREQLAAILWRCAGKPETEGSVEGFADAAKISGYARTPLCWAVEHGIISGKGSGILDPGGSARRCEAAKMMVCYREITEKE